MRPLIGITTYGRIERPAPNTHYEENYTIPYVYVAAVRRAGAEPVLLPPGGQSAAALVDRLDGVVVSGGADVDPTRYDGERTPAVQEPDPERDDAELALTRLIVEQDTPALFVCRGMQVLNVTLGGTLLAHIPDLGIGDIHRNDDGGWITHDVVADSESRVAAAMGTRRTTPFSGHHQAVDRVAPELEVTARAEDGLVEALELPGARWILGVQWHPEVTAAEDPSQQGIFDSLVAGAERT